MDVGPRSRLITTINPPRVILGPAPRSSITAAHPPPSSSSGLTRGSAGRPHARQKWCALMRHRSPTPSLAASTQQIPGSSPRMTRVMVETPRKKLIPAPFVILGPAPGGSITIAHPTLFVILGLDPRIRRASARAAEVVLLDASSVPNPFTGSPGAADPRVKPEDDAGEGGSARKILSPPPSSSSGPPPAAPSPPLTPPPSSSSGSTRGSAGRPQARQKWCSLTRHRSPTPSPAAPTQRIPGSSPRMTRVKVEALRKILSPPHHPHAILPPRCRQGRGCIRASGETDPGSMRVAAGKAQSGRMAGRGTRRSTSYSRKGEGHRREVGRESGDRFPGSPTDPLKMPISRTTNPSPRRRHKPKTPDAWGDDRFIY